MKMYDDYYEVYRTPDMVQYYLSLYIDYCKDKELEPEIKDIEFMSPGMLGHVVYHAKMQELKEQEEKK